MTEEATGRRTKADRWGEVHRRAMQRFDEIWSVQREERTQCTRDRRFARVRGAQWEGAFAFGQATADGEEEATGRARMEIPKFERMLTRIEGEYRSSRKSVDFRARGKASDENALDGLYRADEHDSRGGGQAAYDNAFGEAHLGGFGAWRLRARFEEEESEENERQRVSIEPIYDADLRVFFDPGAQNQDKSDARYAFLLTPYSREAFEDRWSDAAQSSFDPPSGNNRYEWFVNDVVWVAEYYEVEDRGVTRRTFRNIATDARQTYDASKLDEEGESGVTLFQELEETGWEYLRERRIKRQVVRKYTLSGGEVLDEDGLIAGRNIPIVPLYYRRQYIDGIERCQGAMRTAIDAVRTYNLMVSSLAEGAADGADAIPIAAPEQMPGNIADIWARKRIDRPAYLPLVPIYGEDGSILQAGLSGTLTPPQISPSVAALLQVAGADIAYLMGDTDRPETVPSNTSAQAIQIVNDEADVHDFLWKDNFALAMQRSGEIWLGMARELYVEEGREMIALSEQGEQSVVTLSEAALDDEGAAILRNDLTSGSFDVIVDVGSATKTKRDATVRSMLGIAQIAVTAGNQQWAQAAVGVAMLNMEGEGLEGLQNLVRQQGLQAGWVEPTEEEKRELAEAAQNAGPDPQQQLIEAAARQADAEATKASAQAIESGARAEQAKATAAEKLAGIDRDDRREVVETINAIAGNNGNSSGEG